MQIKPKVEVSYIFGNFNDTIFKMGTSYTGFTRTNRVIKNMLFRIEIMNLLYNS